MSLLPQEETDSVNKIFIDNVYLIIERSKIYN